MSKKLITLLFFILIKVNMSLNATTHYPLKGRYLDTPFRIDESLEMIQSGKSCKDEFEAKQGKLIIINPADESPTVFTVVPGDDIRISCSAGWCRSQTLFQIFEKYQGITNRAPHGARDYLDPATGKAKWTVNLEKESLPDEFEDYFGVPKALRFGHEEFSHLRDNINPSQELLEKVSDFYNANYYSPESCDSESGRNVYITFAANAHVILYRLNQTNLDLSRHVVVVIDLDDYITSPLTEWNTYPRSTTSYKNYESILMGLFNFTLLLQKDNR